MKLFTIPTLAFMSLMTLNAHCQTPNVQQRYHPNSVIHLENNEKDTTFKLVTSYDLLNYPENQEITEISNPSLKKQKTRLNYTIALQANDSLVINGTETLDSTINDYVLVGIDSTKYDMYGNQFYISRYNITSASLTFQYLKKADFSYYLTGKMKSRIISTKSGTGNLVPANKYDYYLDSLDNYDYIVVSYWSQSSQGWKISYKADHLNYYQGAVLSEYDDAVESVIQSDSSYVPANRYSTDRNAKGLKTRRSVEYYANQTWEKSYELTYQYDNQNNIVKSENTTFSFGTPVDVITNAYAYTYDNKKRPTKLKADMATNASAFLPSYVEYYTYLPDTYIPGQSTNANNITLFPNPSSGIFNVSINGGSLDNFQVLDMQGRIIIQQKVNSSSLLQLDLTAQSNGVYLLRAFDKFGIKQISMRMMKN